MSEGLQPLNRTAALSTQYIIIYSHKYATLTAKELCTKGLHNIMVQWSNVEYQALNQGHWIAIQLYN